MVTSVFKNIPNVLFFSPSSQEEAVTLELISMFVQKTHPAKPEMSENLRYFYDAVMQL